MYIIVEEPSNKQLMGYSISNRTAILEKRNFAH